MLAIVAAFFICIALIFAWSKPISTTAKSLPLPHGPTASSVHTCSTAAQDSVPGSTLQSQASSLPTDLSLEEGQFGPVLAI